MKAVQSIRYILFAGCLVILSVLATNRAIEEQVDETPLDEELSPFSHPRHYNPHRQLIESGRRVLYVNATNQCNNPLGSPCGPESQCEQVDETSYICQNEFYYGCIAGCGPNSKCVRGADLVYFCKCDENYYQPQTWMPCRIDKSTLISLNGGN